MATVLKTGWIIVGPVFAAAIVGSPHLALCADIRLDAERNSSEPAASSTTQLTRHETPG